MLEIDGSQGEGGGQILRTSLTLALVTGQPVTLTRIRAGRKKPGLLRQHLTAAEAAARIGGTSLGGAKLGSTELRFEPRTLAGGHYHFAIGTAGSTMLVLQTILPALLCADRPSVVELEGGTHNPMSPPFDFVDRVYLPVLRRMGARVTMTLLRPGFFPAGGGRVRVEIDPTGPLVPLELLERGPLRARRALARVAQLPDHVAERELRVVQQRLGWRADELRSERCNTAHGAGNVLTLELEYEHVTELVTGFGEVRRRAEQVATEAVAELERYLEHDAPVGPHLADQLLVPFALAGGGVFRTAPLSLHTTTNLAVLQRFVPLEARVIDEGDTAALVHLATRT